MGDELIIPVFETTRRLEDPEHADELDSSLDSSLTSSPDAPTLPLTEVFGGALGRAWRNAYRVRSGEGEFDNYVDDPVGFIQDVMGDRLWGPEDSPTGHPGQVGIAEAIGKHDDVAIGTCHGIGKTWLLARICIWFWLTRPNSIVLSTAPGNKQVKGLLWRQIRDAHANSRTRLPGTMLTQSANMPGFPMWYMIGFAVDTPAGDGDAQVAVTGQGVHADGGLLFVADEASGVADAIYNTAASYGTAGNAKRVYIGNQNYRSGRFFEAIHSPRSTFVSFQISAFDAPEEVDGKKVISPGWIKKRQVEYGPNYDDNPLYQIQVLGVPPTTDEHTLVPLSLLEENEGLQPELGFRSIGVDVSRLGSDRCVAYLNDNGRLKARHEWGKARTHESAEVISQLMERWKVPNAGDVKVDVTGVGGGVVDDLFRRGIYVDAVDFGGGVKGDWEELVGDLISFPPNAGRRNELHYVFWKLMQAHRLSIPERYRKAWSDAQAMRQVANRPGYWMVEPKLEMKKRIGRSPDDTDAILCSLSRVGSHGESVGGGRVFKRRRRRGAA